MSGPAYLGQGQLTSGNTNELGNQNQTAFGGSSTSTSSQGTGNTQQQNTYLPWQQQLQGQVGQAESNLLSGNVPTSFTNPQATTQAYMNNFNQYVAPELAAQYGAGSPAIGASLNSGLTNLAAQNYQQGITNYGNAVSSAAGTGLTATGQTGNQSQSQTGASNTSEYEDMNDLLSMLDSTTGFGIQMPIW
jgi:hypothetical protein